MDDDDGIVVSRRSSEKIVPAARVRVRIFFNAARDERTSNSRDVLAAEA